MHFIPVFYGLYFDALQAYMSGQTDRVNAAWRRHFEQAARPTRAPSGYGWLREVEASIVSGVTAHVRGDMAPALAAAFRSYTARYCLQGARLDLYRRDFFETNREIVERVKAAFFLEMARLGPSPAGPELTQFLFGAGEQAGAGGLPIEEVYRWRAQAWETALGQLSAAQ